MDCEFRTKRLAWLKVNHPQIWTRPGTHRCTSHDIAGRAAIELVNLRVARTEFTKGSQARNHTAKRAGEKNGQAIRTKANDDVSAGACHGCRHDLFAEGTRIQRFPVDVLFLLFFAIGLWLTEAVPAFAVSLLISE